MHIDPYDLCPCGSGKKVKWCCQKILHRSRRSSVSWRIGSPTRPGKLSMTSPATARIPPMRPHCAPKQLAQKARSTKRSNSSRRRLPSTPIRLCSRDAGQFSGDAGGLRGSSGRLSDALVHYPAAAKDHRLRVLERQAAATTSKPAFGCVGLVAAGPQVGSALRDCQRGD